MSPADVDSLCGKVAMFVAAIQTQAPCNAATISYINGNILNLSLNDSMILQVLKF